MYLNEYFKVEPNTFLLNPWIGSQAAHAWPQEVCSTQFNAGANLFALNVCDRLTQLCAGRPKPKHIWARTQTSDPVRPKNSKNSRARLRWGQREWEKRLGESISTSSSCTAFVFVLLLYLDSRHNLKSGSEQRMYTLLVRVRFGQSFSIRRTPSCYTVAWTEYRVLCESFSLCGKACAPSSRCHSWELDLEVFGSTQLTAPVPALK